MKSRCASLKKKSLSFLFRSIGTDRGLRSPAAIVVFCLVAVHLLAGRSEGQTSGASGRIEWIDIHVHLVVGRGNLQDYEGSIRGALGAMEESGIRKMVVMPPPQVYGNPGNYECDSFAEILKRYPTRFAFLGGGGSLNPMLQAANGTEISNDLRREFEEKASEILRRGALGFGEITAHHLSHEPGHPYESVAADHPLLLLLADIAGRNDALIDFHFDLVTEEMKAPEWLSSPPNPRLFRPNLAAFERLLEHNRKARVVWAHAGSDMLGNWTIELSRRLLGRHPNLYMSLRVAPGRAPQNHPLDKDNKIRPGWLQLLQDFPDRFVIGGDQFFVSPFVQGKGPGVIFSQRAPMNRERTRVFLAALPADLSRKIALENAIRLYGLKD